MYFDSEKKIWIFFNSENEFYQQNHKTARHMLTKERGDCDF